MDEAKTAESGHENTKTKDTSKKKRPLWQKIVAVAVLVIIALVIIINMATSGVTKVSNEFLKDVQAQNSDAAYSLLSKDATAATDKGAFDNFVKRAGPILNTKANMTGKEIKGETGNAATGKVTYEIKGTDNITYSITVNLQKENGHWKVLNFESTKKK